MAQELLAAFQPTLGRLELEPGDGGCFEVTVNGELVFSKLATKRFPELKELKDLVRERLPLGQPVKA
jgi:selenoprotein W-related protein